MDQYPILSFLMRHGQRLAVALAIVPVVVAVFAGAAGSGSRRES